jgi:hypothetical protein
MLFIALKRKCGLSCARSASSRASASSVPGGIGRDDHPQNGRVGQKIDRELPEGAGDRHPGEETEAAVPDPEAVLDTHLEQRMQQDDAQGNNQVQRCVAKPARRGEGKAARRRGHHGKEERPEIPVRHAHSERVPHVRGAVVGPHDDVVLAGRDEPEEGGDAKDLDRGDAKDSRSLRHLSGHRGSYPPASDPERNLQGVPRPARRTAFRCREWQPRRSLTGRSWICHPLQTRETGAPH